jgi:hypothetical protein
MAFSIGLYGYASLERSLGVALGINESVQRGALRSRLKRLAQLGLPAPLEDQEGRRLYSLEECHQLLIAVLLGNLGLDPTVVARAVKKAWKQNLKRGAIKAAQEAGAVNDNPMVLHAKLRIVTEPWRTGNPDTALTIVALQRRYSKRNADLLPQEFETLDAVEWTASLNYTEAAIDLHRALSRGE